MNDKDRTAARSGVGAVMGSKNLKGVVAQGTHKTVLADEEGMNNMADLGESMAMLLQKLQG